MFMKIGYMAADSGDDQQQLLIACVAPGCCSAWCTVHDTINSLARSGFHSKSCWQELFAISWTEVVDHGVMICSLSGHS